MSKHLLIGLLSIILSPMLFANQLAVKNNQDISLTLSQSNYNRLVVKNDKIVEAVFPETSMGIKRDEQDGSVYVLLASQNPFTLFLATESGQHFSVTVTGEESLGKTVELVPAMAVATARSIQTKPTANRNDEQTLVSLIKHMEINQPLSGFNIQKKRQVERWQKGFTLIHQQIWHGSRFNGEVIELYNGGHEPLTLNEAWFNHDKTQAVKLSQKQLLPRQTAQLYLVTAHG